MNKINTYEDIPNDKIYGLVNEYNKFSNWSINR